MPRELIDDAWSAVVQSNEPPYLFLQDTRMSRVVETDVGLKLKALIEDDMQHILLHAADWVKTPPARDGQIPIPVPVWPKRDIGKDMLCAPSPDLPRLDALLSCPCFGPTGRLVASNGYHPSDFIYLAMPEHLHLPPVPPAPTMGEVKAAKELIMEEVFGDFPFVGAADRAHLLAMIISQFVRQIINGVTPGYLVVST